MSQRLRVSLCQRRAGLAIAAALLALACLPACTSRGANLADHAVTERNDEKMRAVTLTTTVERPRVLPGESFAVTVRLHNGGDAPIEVPDPEAENPFVYTLTNTENRGATQEFSRSRYRVVLNPDDRRRDPVQMESLAPGSIAEYIQDFALVATEAVTPGRYLLRVAYPKDNLSSPPVAIEFLRPEALAFAAVASDEGPAISYVLANRSAEGVSVRQWESALGNPVLGASYNRAVLGAGANLRGVATAIEPAEGRGTRWLGWIEGEQFFALQGWDRSVQRTTSPISTGLTEPRLLSPGNTDSSDRGVFVIVGKNGGEYQALKIHVSGKLPTQASAPNPQGLSVSSKASPPENPPEVHRYALGASIPDALRVRYFDDRGESRFQLVGVQTQGNSRQVVARSFAGPTAAEAFRVVYKRDEPLAALAVPPLQAGGEGYTDALFGPAGDEGRMTYVRIPLDGGSATEWSFPEASLIRAEAKSKGPIAQSWTLASGLAKTPPVIARVGGQLLVGWPTAAGGDWQAIREEVDVPQALEVVILKEPDRYERTMFVLLVSRKEGVLVIPLH